MPFAKGNKHGNRFAPGRSGNPKGRAPRVVDVTKLAILVKQAEARIDPNDPESMTYWEAVCKTAFKNAINGKGSEYSAALKFLATYLLPSDASMIGQEDDGGDETSPILLIRRASDDEVEEFRKTAAEKEVG